MLEQEGLGKIHVCEEQRTSLLVIDEELDQYLTTEPNTARVHACSKGAINSKGQVHNA